MTQIHAQRARKRRKDIIPCCIVKLSILCAVLCTQTQTDTVEQYASVCQHHAIFWKCICIFWTESKRTEFHCLHCILRGKHSRFYPFEVLCMCCSAHVDPSFDAFFHHPVHLFAVRYFFPFGHVLRKCQCAEYDVVRVCTTPTLMHTYIQQA